MRSFISHSKVNFVLGLILAFAICAVLEWNFGLLFGGGYIQAALVGSIAGAVGCGIMHLIGSALKPKEEEKEPEESHALNKQE